MPKQKRQAMPKQKRQAMPKQKRYAIPKQVSLVYRFERESEGGMQYPSSPSFRFGKNHVPWKPLSLVPMTRVTLA